MRLYNWLKKKISIQNGSLKNQVYRRCHTDFGTTAEIIDSLGYLGSW